jgi:hypothetical protein
MAESVHRRIAKAMRDRAQHEVHTAKQGHVADVIDTDPLIVQLHENALVIGDDEGLVLTQSVRMYDQAHTIDEGDMVLVDYRAGIWIVTDVVSEKAV